jgi:hypothetical protein
MSWYEISHNARGRRIIIRHHGEMPESARAKQVLKKKEKKKGAAGQKQPIPRDFHERFEKLNVRDKETNVEKDVEDVEEEFLVDEMKEKEAMLEDRHEERRERIAEQEEEEELVGRPGPSMRVEEHVEDKTKGKKGKGKKK